MGLQYNTSTHTPGKQSTSCVDQKQVCVRFVTLQFTWSKSSLADDLVTLLTTLEGISTVVQRKKEKKWNSASLKGSVMFDQAAEWKKLKQKNTDQTRHFSRLIAIQKADWHMIMCGEENGLLTSPYCQFWQFRCWHDVLIFFQNPAWQAQTDTAVSLLVIRAKYQLHLRSSSWPFCSDSQSDVVRICAHDLGVMATLSVR